MESHSSSAQSPDAAEDTSTVTNTADAVGSMRMPCCSAAAIKCCVEGQPHMLASMPAMSVSAGSRKCSSGSAACGPSDGSTSVRKFIHRKPTTGRNDPQAQDESRRERTHAGSARGAQIQTHIRNELHALFALSLNLPRSLDPLSPLLPPSLVSPFVLQPCPLSSARVDWQAVGRRRV